MILIDTMLLKQLARSADRALHDLEEAAGVIGQITEHNDWGCRERHTINAYIGKNRTAMRHLETAGLNFDAVLSQIADEFDMEEKSVGDLFQNIEEVIGDIVSIVPLDTQASMPLVKRVMEDIPDVEDIWNNIAPDILRVMNFKDFVDEISQSGRK